MRTRATVVECRGSDIAIVSVERHAACEGCHRASGDKGCSICTLLGGKQEARARARNTLGAAVGDTVEIESNSGRILRYAALVFLFPILLGLAGYFVAGRFLGEMGALGVSFGCFVLAFLLIWLYSRTVIAKRCDVEIVGIVGNSREQN